MVAYIYIYLLSSPPSPYPFLSFSLFFFNDTATTEIYTLSLHDALPISSSACPSAFTFVKICLIFPSGPMMNVVRAIPITRSEEHTSELQSRFDLVCRLLLEKKKIKSNLYTPVDTIFIVDGEVAIFYIGR